MVHLPPHELLMFFPRISEIIVLGDTQDTKKPRETASENQVVDPEGLEKE